MLNFPHFQAAVGSSPQQKKFFVCIYSDSYMSKPDQIWQFYVHALQRVDVNCVEGQSTRLSIILRYSQAKCKFSAYVYYICIAILFIWVECKDMHAILEVNEIQHFHFNFRHLLECNTTFPQFVISTFVFAAYLFIVSL